MSESTQALTGSESRGRLLFARYRPLMVALAGALRQLPPGAKRHLGERWRTTRGVRGLVLRYCLLKATALDCGDNVAVFPDVFMFSPEHLRIGHNVSIHPMSYIDATGGMTIGCDVAIAHGVTIMSTSHNHDSTAVPMKDQGVTCATTVIGDDVWIGAKATILAGRVVGSGSIVGAGAVVTSDVRAMQKVAGVPARPIGTRQQRATS